MIVTMNRPERYNAMTLHMFARMADAWQRASDDDDIRVIILTGAGGNFSSGVDLRAMAGDVAATDDLDVESRMKEDPGFIYRGLLKTYRPTKPDHRRGRGQRDRRRAPRSCRAPTSGSRARARSSA